jgi:hypothetical protein
MLGITRCEIQLIISRIACDPSAISVLSPSRHEIAPCSITLQQIDIRRMAIQVLLLRKKAPTRTNPDCVEPSRRRCARRIRGGIECPERYFCQSGFQWPGCCSCSVNAKFLWCAKPYRAEEAHSLTTMPRAPDPMRAVHGPKPRQRPDGLFGRHEHSIRSAGAARRAMPAASPCRR